MVRAERNRVRRPIKANRAAAGKRNLRPRAPALPVRSRTGNTFLLKPGRLGGQVLAHQIELAAAVVCGRMKRGLCRRHGKDRSTVSGVNAREAKDVAKERAIRLRSPSCAAPYARPSS